MLITATQKACDFAVSSFVVIPGMMFPPLPQENKCNVTKWLRNVALNIKVEPELAVALQALQSLTGHTGWVNDVVFLPDGEGYPDVYAVTISGDELAMVWNCTTGVVARVVDGHSGEITCCSLSNRGRFLLTGSKDTTCRVWDLACTLAKVNLVPLNAHEPMYC